MTLVLAVLAASLVGSPHCAGMCGGFVCFYAGGPHAGARAHAAYNAGRLVSYLALGLLAGALGARVDAAGELAGVGRAAAVLSGLLMVGWGAARVAAALGLGIGPATAAAPSALRARLGALLRAVRDRPPVVRAATTGLLTTLLPCGWLYAFVATAAGTGSARGGALVMAAFWAGTLPMMWALGAGVRRLAGPIARRLPVVSAAVLVALGVLSIAGKLDARPVLRMAPGHVPTAPAPHVHHR